MKREKFVGQYSLRPLWDAILEIYRAYVAVCKKHRLLYCVDGGTMLGAVRHHGFIPWDDDFDVRMPGPEVDRFLRVASAELPPYFKVVSWKTTKGYPFLFPKIVESRKDVVARVSKESGLPLPQGIYIDIFPYDGYPAAGFARNWYQIRGLLLRMRKNFLFSIDTGTVKSSISRVVGSALKPLFPSVVDQYTYKEYCEKISRSYAYDASDVCGWFNLGKSTMQRLEVRHSWTDMIEIPFENELVPVPSNYDEVLTSFYGDYMRLPPENKRCLFHNWGADVPWKFG